jgi:uncharacterized membrane protein
MQVITHPKHGENVNDFERLASVVAGSLLLTRGLRYRGGKSYLMTLAGAELIRRGATGRCYAYDLLGISTRENTQGAGVQYPLGLRVNSSITVNRPPSEVYGFWRNLENLPRYMRHLKSVTVIDERRSHWVVRAPAGRTVEWDAEIINDVPNELIGWRSTEGSKVQSGGSVRFDPAPGGRGTVIRVELQYNPPGGLIGAAISKLFGEEPTQQIHEDLHSLKQVLEAGEIPTTAGQPAGGKRSSRPDHLPSPVNEPAGGM